MELAPDIRYVKNGQFELAVAFDGCYFTAYHVGSENVGVNISMETVVGLYPEVQDESLLRIGQYGSSTDQVGVWALESVTVDGLPPVPKNVVSDIDDEPATTLTGLQRRLDDLSDSEPDLIKTLEQTVESLDDVIAAPKKVKHWASALIPILEASAAQGVSMNDVLKEISKRIDRRERCQ